VTGAGVTTGVAEAVGVAATGAAVLSAGVAVAVAFYAIDLCFINSMKPGGGG